MFVLGPFALIGSLSVALHVAADPTSPSVGLPDDAIVAPASDLEIAGPLPPPLVPPRQLPKAAPVEGRVGWGTLAVTILAPSVFHVRAGESSRSGAGLAFLSLVGRGWSVPAPGRAGQVWRLGAAISAVEGTIDKTANAFIWPLEGQISTGPRFPLGGSTYVYALVGFEGLYRASPENDAGAQRRRAYLHVPEVSLGLQSKTRATLWELGPLGGLAVAGHDSVRFRSATPLVGPGTYTLRPYVGALASFVAPVSTFALSAHRTVITEGGAGFDDRLSALLCHSFTEVRHHSGLGGCLSADVAHARAVPAGSPALWSYEVTFRLGGVLIGR